MGNDLALSLPAGVQTPTAVETKRRVSLTEAIAIANREAIAPLSRESRGLRAEEEQVYRIKARSLAASYERALIANPEIMARAVLDELEGEDPTRTPLETVHRRYEKPEERVIALTPEELASLAEATVVDLEVWESDDRAGHGRVILQAMWERGLDVVRFRR